MIDWKEAPEGAVRLEQNCRCFYWINADNAYYCVRTDSWKTRPNNTSWTVIATRPEPKRKTIEDALDAYPDGWPSEYHAKCWIGVHFAYDRFTIYKKNSPVDMGHTAGYKICTREEFEEAHAKRKAEQAGQEWTHRTSYGMPCRVVLDEPDDFGLIVINSAGNGYEPVEPSDLTPIPPEKPTLTKAQAWDMCQDYAGMDSMEEYMVNLGEAYNIVDDKEAA